MGLGFGMDGIQLGLDIEHLYVVNNYRNTSDLKGLSLNGMQLHLLRRLANHSLTAHFSFFSTWHFFFESARSKNMSELDVSFRTDIL